MTEHPMRPGYLIDIYWEEEKYVVKTLFDYLVANRDKLEDKDISFVLKERDVRSYLASRLRCLSGAVSATSYVKVKLGPDPCVIII